MESLPVKIALLFLLSLCSLPSCLFFFFFFFFETFNTNLTSTQPLSGENEVASSVMHLFKTYLLR